MTSIISMNPQNQHIQNMVNTLPKSISDKAAYMIAIQQQAQQPTIRAKPVGRVREQVEVIPHKSKGK